MCTCSIDEGDKSEEQMDTTETVGSEVAAPQVNAGDERNLLCISLVEVCKTENLFYLFVSVEEEDVTSEEKAALKEQETKSDEIAAETHPGEETAGPDDKEGISFSEIPTLLDSVILTLDFATATM